MHRCSSICWGGLYWCKNGIIVCCLCIVWNKLNCNRNFRKCDDGVKLLKTILCVGKNILRTLWCKIPLQSLMWFCLKNGPAQKTANSALKLAHLRMQNLIIFHCSVLCDVKSWCVACCCDVQLWALETGKLVCTLDKHTGPANAVQFHPSELLLASGSSDMYADHQLLFHRHTLLETSEILLHHISGHIVMAAQQLSLAQAIMFCCWCFDLSL